MVGHRVANLKGGPRARNPFQQPQPTTSCGSTAASSVSAAHQQSQFGTGTYSAPTEFSAPAMPKASPHAASFTHTTQHHSLSQMAMPHHQHGPQCSSSSCDADAVAVEALRGLLTEVRGAIFNVRQQQQRVCESFAEMAKARVARRHAAIASISAELERIVKT